MVKYKKDVGAVVREGHASFRVWAPFAKNVSVIIAAGSSFEQWPKTPMERDEDGYWSAVVKGAKAGEEYKYVIETEDGRTLYKNDPRSLHVTTTDGNSVLVDTDFDWQDQDFKPAPLEKQVLYELHVGTFNRADSAVPGTFDDVTEKLDYLVDLGITTIELMPINSMSGDRGWGYTTNYIYAIESLYGGRRAFMEFVNAAHQKGLSVVLDVVYNHLGPAGELDLWQFDGWCEDGKGGIYFYNDWRAYTPWCDTLPGEDPATIRHPRPDFGRPEVQQFIVDNVKMWLDECHLDGLRLDSTGYMRNVYGNNSPESDIPEAWKLLQEITAVARKINPTSLLIAEDIGSNEYITKPTKEGGAGFRTQWEVGFPWVLRRALDPADDAYRNLGELSGMLEHRYNGDAFQRVIYSDSHDSAANGGARLSEEISPGHPDSVYSQRRTLIAAAMVLTLPGVPMLFQGQEFLQGGSFNDWQALDWQRLETCAGIVLAHKHLVMLRKNQYGNTRGLTGQSFAVTHLNEESKVLAYHRWDQGGASDDVVVVFNMASQTLQDYLIPFPRPGTWKVRFNSDWQGYSPDFQDTQLAEVVVENDSATMTIAPYSVFIFSQD